MDQGSSSKASGVKTDASIPNQDSSPAEVTECQPRLSGTLRGGGGPGKVADCSVYYSRSNSMCRSQVRGTDRPATGVNYILNNSDDF